MTLCLLYGTRKPKSIGKKKIIKYFVAYATLFGLLFSQADIDTSTF